MRAVRYVALVATMLLFGVDPAGATSTVPPSHVEAIILARWAGTGDGPRAVRIARCESRLNPLAKSRISSASGVFQIIRGTWRGHASPGMSVWNTWHNIEVAYRIWLRSGRSFRQWVCRG